MESVNTKPKAKGLPINRVVLSQETANKLDAWAEQVEVFCPGIGLKRQNLVEWLVTSKEQQLPTSDQKALKEQFYDDIELATWALQQLKAAKARNEKVSLADLLKGGKTKATDEVPKRAKRKSPPTSEIESPQIEVPPSALPNSAD